MGLYRISQNAEYIENTLWLHEYNGTGCVNYNDRVRTQQGKDAMIHGNPFPSNCDGKADHFPVVDLTILEVA